MRGTPFLHEGFTGGLNTLSDPYLLEENECRDCMNVVSTQRGSIKKRYGSTQFLPAGVPNTELTSMFACNIAGTPYLLVSNGKEIWSVTATGTVTEIGKGFTAASRWSMVQAPASTGVASEGPVYMVNGVDKPQFWTGAEAKTEVKEWKGVAANPKLTDGVTGNKTLVLKSETAGFIAGDIGLTVTFESVVKAAGVTVPSAQIMSVVSAKEVTLNINAAGFDEAYANVHFTIERSFYKEGEHVPNGQFMVFAGNRIWMTGVKADSSAVWFSEFISKGEAGAQADPSQWPTTNVVRFDASDGGSITGIGTVGPYLCVFKESKTWIIHDMNTGSNRRIADTIGCVSHRSIVETTGGTFFLTADQGVYLTNGSTLHEMSYNVRPTILAVNPKQRANAAGAYFNNHYYLSFASGTSETPNKTLDYDAQLKSWWPHDLCGNQWTLWEPTAGLPNLFAITPKAKAGVSKCFVEGVYTDLGENYTGNGVLGAFWLSAWNPFAYYIFRHRIKAPFLKKRVRQVFFNGEGQIIPAVYKNFNIGERQEPAVVGALNQATEDTLPVNFAAAAEKWGEGSGEWGKEVGGTEVMWGGESSIGTARMYALGTANVWGVGFGNNSAEPFTVNAYVMMISFRKS